MVPTIDLFIETRSMNGFTWEAHPIGACPEIAYSRAELLRLLQVFGHWASVITNGAHLRLWARGRYTGLWVAEWEWARYEPAGEPWTCVPPWENLPFAGKLRIPRYSDHDRPRLITTVQTDVSELRRQYSA